MARKKFHIRKKPARPVRKTIKETASINDGDLLSSFPEGAWLEFEYDYDLTSCWVVWEREESNEELASRIRAYETALAKYNQWYADSKDAIAAELEAREQDEKDKWEKEVVKLQRERDALDKRLAKLGADE